MITIETPEFVSFLAGCQKIIDDHRTEHFPNMKRETLEVMPGRRYFRIVKVGISQRSAWAFIDATNGDVLKTDGWKAPAKHARGNVFDAKNGLGLISAYGPAYLR